MKTKGETERDYLYTADAVTAILTVLLNGSKKNVKVEIPQGNYIVLAQNGKADVDGLGAYAGAYINASATSATILAEN